MSKIDPSDAHYIDNERFLKEMTEYVNEYRISEKEGKDLPAVSEYVGECFLKIAKGLSFKNNFINYTYHEDFISDGVYCALLYAHNFDPEKSHNPFAYFTSLIYYAFVRRIKNERKQMYLKYKVVENSGIYESITNVVDRDNALFHKMHVEYLSSIREYDKIFSDINNTEEKKKRKKKHVPKNLETFFME